jgi:hypothetical protein
MNKDRSKKIKDIVQESIDERTRILGKRHYGRFVNEEDDKKRKDKKPHHGVPPPPPNPNSPFENALAASYGGAIDTGGGVPEPLYVTEGLTFNIDCLNADSYPGTGTTWASTVNSANDGTLNNNVTFVAPHMVFNGGVGDNVSFPNALNNVIQTPMTLEIWLHRDTDVTQAVIATHDKPTAGPPAFNGDGIFAHFTPTSPAGRFYLYGLDYAAGSGNGQYLWDNSPGWNPGVWMQLIIVIGGQGTAPPTETEVLLYRNGIPDAWTSPNLYYGGGGYASPTLDDLIIGGYPSGIGNFNGKIDIVRIYDRALTPEEITQNFEAENVRFGL